MGAGNPFTLLVCTLCVGALEMKIVALPAGASEEREVVRRCCPSEEGEKLCSEGPGGSDGGGSGQPTAEQRQKQRSS